MEKEKYEAVLLYLFDRPEPDRAANEQEWYWNIEERDFDATPLEWTRIQTVLFAHAGEHLARFSDEQVGMGLNYLMNNSISNVAFTAAHESVPRSELLRMMDAMADLWRDCMGPRLADLHRPIGSGDGNLGFVCYMWFDVWPLPYWARDIEAFKDALWHLFQQMLKVPAREVQFAALHGIGHEKDHLQRDKDVEDLLAAFAARVASVDPELSAYAQAAATGRVL